MKTENHLVEIPRSAVLLDSTKRSYCEHGGRFYRTKVKSVEVKPRKFDLVFHADLSRPCQLVDGRVTETQP